jgi:acyl-CoA thioesterase FadM
VPIRWSDVDRQGHVNNVSLAGYLQEARILATTSWHLDEITSLGHIHHLDGLPLL